MKRTTQDLGPAKTETLEASTAAEKIISSGSGGIDGTSSKTVATSRVAQTPRART
jgi:hypothetical protein